VFWCKIGYFKTLSSVVWPNYADWFTVSSDWKNICNGNCTSSYNPKILFSNLKLKWEWVYTITIRTFDKTRWGKVKLCNGSLSVKVFKWDAPGNCSETKIIYKIDKTHPNIVDPLNTNSSYLEIDENSKYVYVWRSKKQTSVKDWDAVSSNIWTSEKVIKWNTLLDNPWSETVTRKNLKTIYYSSGNQEITIKLNLKNYFSSQTYTNYISPLTKVQLLDSNYNVKKNWLLSNPISFPDWSGTNTINSLLDNWVNQKIFYLRVYDKAWNYSETPFYVVKDDMSPITLSEFLNTFEFSGWEKIFYTTSKLWPQVDGTNSIPSKFFAANSGLQLTFSISDNKLWSTNTGNAWLLKFKLKIEEAGNCWVMQTYTFIPSDNLNQESWTTISQSWTINHDFSKVDGVSNDNCLRDENNTYRYYRAHIISIDDDWNQYQDKICDKVGNCTTIVPLVFRVVANKLGENKSKVKISFKNLVDNEKLLSNWKSSYVISFTLKDKYWNKIVPVFSQEDNTNVKNSKLTFTLYNKLSLNQIDLNWELWTYKKSLEWDDLTSIDGKLTWNFVVQENPEDNPNWVYTIKIYSVVPTKDYYPWISSGSYLRIDKINFLSKDLTNNWNIVKKDDIGQYNTNLFSGWSEIKVTLNKGNLSYSDTANRYLTVNNNYGNIDVNPLANPKSFNSEKNKKIYLDFASPVLVGFYNLKAINEWVKNVYDYNVWNFDTGNITSWNIQLYEEWMSVHPYDFSLWSGSNEYKTGNIWITWSNLLSLSKNLPLINNISNFKNKISKFTKITVDPILSSIINSTNSHIAVGTKLSYNLLNNIIILPSDGRWIADTKNTDVDKKEFWDSLSILKGVISASDSSAYDNSELNPVVKNIKVLWNVSSRWQEKNLLSTDKTRNIWWDIKKWQVRNNIIKKVWQLSRWVIKWCDSSDISILSKFDDINKNCVINVWNEKIAFFKDTDIHLNDYSIKWIETIVVKNWNIFIDGNIYKTNDKALLSLVSLNDKWFSRKSLSYSIIKNYISNTTTNKIYGFVFINPKVTNIDAYIYAQWSVMSYNWDKKLYDGSNVTDTSSDKNMYNQLYVRWWLISTNTIGWSRLVWDNSVKYDKKCPWFLKESDCNINTAQAFDLVYLRRYSLIEAKNYWVSWSSSWTLIPYVPFNVANNIGEYNNNKVYMWWKRYCKLSDSSVDSSVDCSKDDDGNLVNIPDKWMEYPLYIEYDPTIQHHTPVIFRP
jgi:hypothetical protein